LFLFGEPSGLVDFVDAHRKSKFAAKEKAPKKTASTKEL
jgi:hypothetical protein